ncbi:Plant SNARE 13 [Heracleum sosnowskyi]|uniref:Plant SNARE 13 n=1 Tax=Heracleum sosnowskyi TaxID=360622 RepID=A0AAD8MLY8_9APIA|nr:Plant SNARE 13 [Heracleum sosnowskyi]
MFQLLVLSSYAFDAGISLMLYQNLINCILVALLSLFGAVTVEKLNWKLIRVWLPVNVIFVGMLVSGMYRYMCSLGNKKVELFDSGVGPSEPTAEDNVQMASTMSNQELITAGNKTMDETDQAIERSKQVVHQTVEVGTQTASTLKGQTDQMGRIVNELDTIQFSIKKASQLVKEIGRQVATDKCIMLFLFLIVCGVVAVIVVKVNSF